MDPLKTGKIIAEARKKLNMTQKDLANKLFISDKAVSKWERGLSFPDISVLIPLSEILNVNLYDLLKGEKMKEEKVEEILKETINYTNKEIKKSKKKYHKILLSIILIELLSLLSVTLFLLINKYKIFDRYDYTKESWYIKPYSKFSEDNSNPVLAFKEGITSKENGWVCKFKIEYLKNDKYATTESKNEYFYNCYNIKYWYLKDFNYYIYHDLKYYATDNITVSYANNLNYRDDLFKISNYFYDKQFDRKITTADLNELELNYIKKEDVLDLFNKAVTSKAIDSYGKYPKAINNIKTYEYSSVDTGNTYYLGYMFDDSGNITNVYIDISYYGERLQDFIWHNENIDSEYKELYNIFKEIEEYIIKNQTFDIPKKYKNNKYCKELKKHIFNNVNKIINYSEKEYSIPQKSINVQESETINQEVDGK